MKRLTILIDIDDTIECLCKTWVTTLNSKFGTNVRYEDITKWDMPSFFPGLTEEQVFEPLRHDDFWKYVEPIPGAAQYMRMLIDNGHEVFLCTSTDYRNIKPKFEYVVQKHFPFIEWKRVIVAHKKQMINADILIDDGEHNLEGGNYFGILFTAPHNKQYNAEEHGLVRANNWREVYKLVCKYASDKEGDQD